MQKGTDTSLDQMFTFSNFECETATGEATGEVTGGVRWETKGKSAAAMYLPLSSWDRATQKMQW